MPPLPQYSSADILKGASDATKPIKPVCDYPADKKPMRECPKPRK
jgi:hypothetical protein